MYSSKTQHLGFSFDSIETTDSKMFNFNPSQNSDVGKVKRSDIKREFNNSNVRYKG